MLAMSSTRQTLVEKPSVLLLLWISWNCGTYGRAPPNTMREDANNDSSVHEPSLSSCRTTSASITPGESQQSPGGLVIAPRKLTDNSLVFRVMTAQQCCC